MQQIRAFMARFELGSEPDIANQLQATERALSEAKQRRTELEHARSAQTHPTDDLREHLRRLSADIGNMVQAVSNSQELIAEQKALRAELITQKRLRDADENILAIAAEFKLIMLSVDFPGVSQDDRIVIDPRH